MKIPAIFFTAVLLTSVAHADFNLASNGKAVLCYGEDNVSINLNAKRTWIKYTVEGEMVTFKIKKTDSDGDTRVTYIAAETDSQGGFVLNLDDQGDNYSFGENDELAGIKCR